MTRLRTRWQIPLCRCQDLDCGRCHRKLTRQQECLQDFMSRDDRGPLCLLGREIKAMLRPTILAVVSQSVVDCLQVLGPEAWLAYMDCLLTV